MAGRRQVELDGQQDLVQPGSRVLVPGPCLRLGRVRSRAAPGSCRSSTAPTGQPLPRRSRQADAGRMSRIAVVTSSPPLVEGGHLVIARVARRGAPRGRALAPRSSSRPQNRFGRQASAYLATWLTDVGIERRPADRSGDLPALPELRRAAPASRVLAEPHDARVLRPVASLHATVSARQARRRSACGGRLIHGADRYLLTRNVTQLFVQSRTIQQRLRDVARAAHRRALSAAAAARVPLRRLRRLRVHGVAAHAAQARGSVAPRRWHGPRPRASAP